MPGAWSWFQKKVLGRSDVYIDGKLYMRRWLFGPQRWYGLRVHHIVRSDVGPLHDHPFDFVSFILWGGYCEELPGRFVLRQPLTFARRKAENIHAIRLHKYPPAHGLDFGEIAAWTIVLRGPYRREWGYWVDGQGWTAWRAWAMRKGYHRGVAAGEFAAASST